MANNVTIYDVSVRVHKKPLGTTQTPNSVTLSTKSIQIECVEYTVGPVICFIGRKQIQLIPRLLSVRETGKRISVLSAKNIQIADNGIPYIFNRITGYTTDLGITTNPLYITVTPNDSQAVTLTTKEIKVTPYITVQQTKTLTPAGYNFVGFLKPKSIELRKKFPKVQSYIPTKALNPASFRASLGTVLDYDGHYLNADGQLDSTKYIQDGYYYQQFSYVLKTGESAHIYKKSVKDFIHPAGMLMFGSFAPVYNADGGIKSQDNHTNIVWKTDDLTYLHLNLPLSSLTLDDVVGSFLPDEFITGSNGARGRVFDFDGTTLRYNAHSGEFEDSTTISGDSSGATATINGLDINPNDGLVYVPRDNFMPNEWVGWNILVDYPFYEMVDDPYDPVVTPRTIQSVVTTSSENMPWAYIKVHQGTGDFEIDEFVVQKALVNVPGTSNWLSLMESATTIGRAKILAWNKEAGILKVELDEGYSGFKSKDSTSNGFIVQETSGNLDPNICWSVSTLDYAKAKVGLIIPPENPEVERIDPVGAFLVLDRNDKLFKIIDKIDEQTVLLDENPGEEVIGAKYRIVLGNSFAQVVQWDRKNGILTLANIKTPQSFAVIEESYQELLNTVQSVFNPYAEYCIETIAGQSVKPTNRLLVQIEPTLKTTKTIQSQLNDLLYVEIKVTSGNLNYQPGEYVYQGTTRGIVVDWDQTTNVLKVINNVGDFLAGAVVSGQTSWCERTAETVRYIGAHKLGPSLKSIERDKFKYRPSSLMPSYFNSFSAEQIAWMQILGLNIDEEAPSNPIGNFNAYVTKSFNTTPWTKTPYSPEPIISETSPDNLVRLVKSSVLVDNQNKTRFITDINSGTWAILSKKQFAINKAPGAISDYNSSSGDTDNYLDRISNINCCLWLSPNFVTHDESGVGYPYITRAKTSGKPGHLSVGFDFVSDVLNASNQPVITRKDNKETLNKSSNNLSSADYSIVRASYIDGKLIENGDAGVSHYVMSNAIQILSGVTYRLRARVKYGTRSCSLRFDSSAGLSGFANFDLQTGGLLGTTGSVTNQKIVKDTDDYYIISAECQASSDGSGYPGVYLSNPAGTVYYDGNSSGYAYVSWMQFQTVGADEVYTASATYGAYRGSNENQTFYFHGNTQSHLRQLAGNLTPTQTSDANNTFGNLINGDTNFSLAGTFIPDLTTKNQTIFSIADVINAPSQLLDDAFSGSLENGKFTVKIRTGTGNGTLNEIFDYAYEGVNHFVFKRVGVNLYLKLNDRPWVSGTTAETNLHTNVTSYGLQFGQNVFNANNYQGKLGDIVLYNRDLNSAETDDLLKTFISKYGQSSHSNKIVKLNRKELGVSALIRASFPADIVVNGLTKAIRIFRRRLDLTATDHHHVTMETKGITLPINVLLVNKDPMEVTLSTSALNIGNNTLLVNYDPQTVGLETKSIDLTFSPLAFITTE